jgi:NAD(P)-dependent dehydrogenase (short-subunit alcohol dehydrogenase family)
MNILITGGASGLGEAITKKLASNLQNKIFFTFSKSKDNAKKIEEEFLNTTSIKCDFGNTKELELLIDKINDIDIDVLINNAYSGSFLNSYFHKTNDEDFLNGFATNVFPTIKITKATISLFRKKRSGKIITILSAALINTPPIGSSVYVANKSYLSSLVKIWATENAKFNITSNSISPSFMKTSLTSSFDERLVEQMIENHPYKKLLTVEEVAETVSFLVNATNHINGIDFLINAGTNIK